MTRPGLGRKLPGVALAVPAKRAALYWIRSALGRRSQLQRTPMLRRSSQLLPALVALSTVGHAQAAVAPRSTADVLLLHGTVVDGTGSAARHAALAAQLTITPSHPAPGEFVQLRLTTSDSSGDSIRAVTGTMAGEPLHFARGKDDGYSALGAVPVDSAARTTVEVIIGRASGRADTLLKVIEVLSFPPPSEKLDVASRFGQALDSALEVRVAREGAMAREIGRRSHDTPRLWRAPFIRPRPSAITSRFGAGRTFNGQVTSRHLGVDFRGAKGDAVRAANRGVVALVDTFYLGGRIVYVDHGEGLVTAYMHLSKALVAVGDTVARGQRIGLVGATGRVTGPHLHWAARYGTLTANPFDLLSLPNGW